MPLARTLWMSDFEITQFSLNCTPLCPIIVTYKSWSYHNMIYCIYLQLLHSLCSRDRKWMCDKKHTNVREHLRKKGRIWIFIHIWPAEPVCKHTVHSTWLHTMRIISKRYLALISCSWPECPKSKPNSHEHLTKKTLL